MSPSDPHTGDSGPKRSKRGQRAGIGASLQPDLGEPGKESNGNFIQLIHVNIVCYFVPSDPHTGDSRPKRSRRGQRAVSPGIAASLQPDLGELGKENNGNFIQVIHVTIVSYFLPPPPPPC